MVLKFIEKINSHMYFYFYPQSMNEMKAIMQKTKCVYLIIILYKYGTWVSAISIFIALRKMILHEALAPSAISFFRVQ